MSTSLSLSVLWHPLGAGSGNLSCFLRELRLCPDWGLAEGKGQGRALTCAASAMEGPRARGRFWVQGSHLHSLALQLGKMHTDIRVHSSPDFHSEPSHFLQGKFPFCLLLGRAWIALVDGLAERFSCHGSASWQPETLLPTDSPFVPLDHGNSSAKASPTSLLGGAGFTAQPPDTMQMVPEVRLWLAGGHSVRPGNKQREQRKLPPAAPREL